MFLLGVAFRVEAVPLLETGFRGFPAGPVPYSIAAGDLNSDGRDDLLVLNASGAAILLATPDRMFGQPIALELPRIRGLTIAQATSDTRADLVVLPWDDPVALRYPGRGDATFDSPDTVALPGLGVGVTVRDFDGDGTNDIAVAAATSVVLS